MKITALKKYGERVVLNVNLTFDKGKIYAVIGSNGSGKSTLLKILAGLLKYDGQADSGPEKHDIGYLPQKSYAFDMSVINNMLLNNMIRERKTRKKEAEELLKDFGLLYLRKKNAASLSGGETQRLAFARLFMREFKLLLLDEPTASMDVNSTVLTEGNLLKYREKYSPTVIFATHSFAQAKRLADEVIFLSDGICEERGAPEVIFENPRSEITRQFLNLNS